MMSTQEVKIVCMDGATMPAYATPGSAGVDLRAHLQVALRCSCFRVFRLLRPLFGL